MGDRVGGVEGSACAWLAWAAGWGGVGRGWGLGWAGQNRGAGLERKRKGSQGRLGWSGCGGGLSARGWAGLVGWGLGCAGGWAGVAGLGAGMGEIEVLGLKA